jgi:adhesin/invasin
MWRAAVAAVAVGSVAGAHPAMVGAGPAGPRFVVPDRTPTGGVLPEDVATGDFTGDGNADVIVANLGPDAFTGGVAVLRGDGTGNLADPIRTGVGTQNGTQEVAPGDFDEDGRLDAAVVTGTTGGAGPIRILIGNGAGGFTLGQTLLAGDGHIEAADFTGDGHLDLAFLYEGGAATVKLFPGLGTGRFGAAVDLPRSWDAYDLEVADVNGDGRPDLVGASGGPVWVMLNQGGGAFSEQVSSYDGGITGLEMTLGELTGDGIVDVAVVTASDGGVKIGRGTGDGHFVLASQLTGVSFATGWIASGDWTGDGLADLVVNNEYASESNIVVLFKGAGNGTFGGATYWTTGNDDPTPVHLDGDGRLDLVTFSSDPGFVYATLNAGSGKLRAPQSTVAPALGAPETGDVNADGLPDVVTVGTRVAAYLGRGSGKFTPVVSSNGVSEGVGQIRLADFNEDGKLDVVAGLTHIGPLPNNLAVFTGNGAGGFSGPTRLPTTDWNASNESVAAGDVNGDGHADIVGRTNTQLAVLRGNGNGTFQPALLSGVGGFGQFGTHLTDVTGDGVLDVVAIVKTGGPDFGSGVVRVERGNGDGTFTLLQTLGFDGNPGTPGLIADLDGDGRDDVALTATRGSNGGRSGMRVGLNTGTAIGPLAFYAYPPFPLGDIDAADFDADGDLDIAGAGFVSLAVAVNDGAGTFTTPVELVGTTSSSRVAADFTGDGRPDIFSINSTDRALYSIYVNRSR